MFENNYQTINGIAEVYERLKDLEFHCSVPLRIQISNIQQILRFKTEDFVLFQMKLIEIC